MSDYRAYLVGLDGHLNGAEIIGAPDDVIAKKQVDGYFVEVWELDRKVVVLAPECGR